MLRARNARGCSEGWHGYRRNIERAQDRTISACERHFVSHVIMRDVAKSVRWREKRKKKKEKRKNRGEGLKLIPKGTQGPTQKFAQTCHSPRNRLPGLKGQRNQENRKQQHWETGLM